RIAEQVLPNLAGDDAVHFPCVCWEQTTDRVLPLQRISGIKIDHFAALDTAGMDRAGIANRGARMVLKMVFADRFFHAAPHPGNFFIEPDGRIGVVDFGMVGTVGSRIQEQLTWGLLAYASEDPDRQVGALF